MHQGAVGSTFFITLVVVDLSQPKNICIAKYVYTLFIEKLSILRAVNPSECFYLWSGEENNSNNAYNRNFNSTNSNYNNNNRNNSNKQAVCLGDGICLSKCFFFYYLFRRYWKGAEWLNIITYLYIKHHTIC